MKKLLASDYDGTLSRNRQILPQDKAAIEEWQRAGNLFCLCSGRAPLSAIAEMERCELHPDLLICSNGASAIDMDGNFLFRHKLPSQMPRKIFALAHEYAVTAFNGQTYNGELHQHSYIDPTRVTIGMEDLLKIEDFLQFNAVFTGSQADADAFSDRVDQELKEITAHRNGVYIDCSVAGVDKGTGVAEIAAHFGIALENCYTIGDNNNDLAMLLPYHGAVIETGNPITIQKVGHPVPDIASFIQEIL